MKRILFVAVVFCSLIAAVTGCTEKVPVGTVSGSVKYKGEPMTIGVVVFCSPDSVNRAGGEIDSAGNFVLTGPLPAGEYLVGFAQPYFDEPDRDRPPELTSPLPAKYLAYETSGIKFTIKEGENKADFDL